MTCSQVQALINARPLAEFHTTQLEGAERHARDCVTCGPALAAARALELELAGLPELPLPAGLTAGIVAAIARLDDGPTFRHVTAAPAAAARRDRARWSAVLAGIAIGVGVLVYRVLTGEIAPNVTSTRLGGWGERLTDIPTATPGVILAAGLLLYLAGLLAPVNSTDTHRKGPNG